MKKIIIILISACFLLGINSCKKAKSTIDQLTEFDMSYSSDFTVPASSVTVNQPADFTTQDIPTNSSQYFAGQKTAADKITEITLTKLNLTTSGNFDYLKSITIYIQAPGQPEAQVATKTSIPTGINSLDLDVSSTNIKNYITGSTFKFRINVTIDGAITSDQTMKLNETMHVKATLLN